MSAGCPRTTSLRRTRERQPSWLPASPRRPSQHDRRWPADVAPQDPVAWAGPSISSTGRPASFASRRASGLAKTRAPGDGARLRGGSTLGLRVGEPVRRGPMAVEAVRPRGRAPPPCPARHVVQRGQGRPARCTPSSVRSAARSATSSPGSPRTAIGARPRPGPPVGTSGLEDDTAVLGFHVDHGLVGLDGGEHVLSHERNVLLHGPFGAGRPPCCWPRPRHPQQARHVSSSRSRRGRRRPRRSARSRHARGPCRCSVRPPRR